MSLPIVIIGAGGHAAVVADALLAVGAEVIGFTSRDAPERPPQCGLPILGDDCVLERWRPEQIRLVNGVGSIDTSGIRRLVQERLEAQGWHFIGVRHPAATVSPYAVLADGVQLLAHSVVQSGARVGRGCIVNTGAIVEHDVILDDWVHIAPRAVVCGDAVVGTHSHVGAGAVVRQGVRLGARTLIGVGAAVVKDFAGDGCLLGVPARAQIRHLGHKE